MEISQEKEEILYNCFKLCEKNNLELYDVKQRFAYNKLYFDFLFKNYNSSENKDFTVLISGDKDYLIKKHSKITKWISEALVNKIFGKAIYCNSCDSVFFSDGVCDCKKNGLEHNDYGLVYFIKVFDRVKIGHVQKESYNAIEERLKILITGMPARKDEIEIIHYEQGGYKREQELHKIFKDQRLDPHREWFYYNNKIENYVKNKLEVN